MSSRGGWSRRPGASGVGLTAGVWLASVVRGVAGLGGAGARPPAGLMPSSVVLGHTVGAWVPVGLLSGLVVIHPVRVCVCACVRVCVCACCWRRRGHQGSVKGDHVL